MGVRLRDKRKARDMHTMACDAVGLDGEISLQDLPIFHALCKKCQIKVSEASK